MAFEPWLQHDVQSGMCTRCGMVLPFPEAIYTHHFQNGDPVFSSTPGRYEPCQPSTDK